MNGKRAKKLRKIALGLLHKEGVSGGEGVNTYNQAMNCPQWKPYIDEEGMPKIDPDTKEPLMIIKRGPGTITTAHRFRILYKELKRRWAKYGALTDGS